MTLDSIIEKVTAGFTVDLTTGLANYRIEVYRQKFDPSPTDEKFARINQNGVRGPMLSKSEFVDKVNSILPYLCM